MATLTLTLNGVTKDVEVAPPGADHFTARLGILGTVLTEDVFVDGWGEKVGLTFWPYVAGSPAAFVVASDGKRYQAAPCFEPGFVPVHEGNIVGWADEEVS